MPSDQPAPAGQQPSISVIILTFGSAKFIGPCISSVVASTRSPVEVVVVDNASTDDSLKLAEEAASKSALPLKPIPLQCNLGCAGGNNAGWRASMGEVLVFLNPDTEITPGFLDELVRPLLNDTDIGITGAKMVYPGSRVLQHAGGIVYPNGMTAHHGLGQQDRGQFDTQRDVDYVTGAGFAIRRELMESLGGFDEEYFPAYYEEVDLCMRVRQLGKRIVYVPSAVMVHHESVSLGADSPALRRMYSRMRIQFCLKNFSLFQLLRWSIPCEIRWMLTEPAARGHRAQQLRSYVANWRFLLRKLSGGNRSRARVRKMP
ncbi:MAG: glycosyltransferase family 2 protein [Candidatus Sumerlaeaceae bacterium]